MTSVPLLTIDELSVAFKTRKGTVQALHGVSFTLEKGEIIGLVGESGSGKSVTAYNVLGLLGPAARVTGGRIGFGGMTMTTARESALREIRGREISMIFQNPRGALNPIRPVGRQIEDVLREHSDLPRHKLKGAAIDMLHQVRINEPERRYAAYPFELSGGMCQRVMIAMALACEPALLIADEPTTGLDVTTQKAIMDLLVELARARHMATLLITHDLGIAAQYCDRIMVMEKGRLVEGGATADLFRAPRHPYTRKLIAATPRPDSTLADLIASTGTPARPAAEAPATAVAPNAVEPLLEVTDLVKEYPLAEKTKASGLGPLQRWFGRTPQTAGKDEPGQPPAGVFRAVDGVSFTVMPGESVGLVGESGCGKSTTSSMVARLLDPTSGAIRFDGQDIAAVPAGRFARSPLRAGIQMVFQDPTDSLNPRHTAFAAIAEPIRRLATPGDGPALTRRIEALADRVGLPRELLSRFPHQLSGGQKARVGIARAIAVDPKLLILDEPTSALDVSVQAVVLELLDGLRRELGMSYLFVSHDLNVVRLLCHRVLVMHRGRIVESGPAERLLTSPDHPYTKALIDAVPHFVPDGDPAAPTPEAAALKLAGE
ncbi:MAG: dipeptide ABC transporter ATP-binding protein [Alphaproteobacteria bacterium]|jgi:peptide/nickel transport system ATP-binding protein|nr:dipeptide ABC transporter ATP-binding protein [Alphaproteobacteria bacterium]